MGPLTQEPDSTSASLIERVCRFDETAWNRLSAIYGPLVYRWCRRAGLQEADAADVLQDVFSALVRDIGTFRRDEARGGFRGWLYGITRHKLADHFRDRAHQPAAGGDRAEPRQRPADSFAPLPEPADSDAADEHAIVLHAALEQIRGEYDEHNWQAFFRTAIRQESAVAVAADLGLTPGAARQAKFRVLRRLRRELDGLSLG